MPAPNPEQYDGFASEYESHAEQSAYNAYYDRPATLELVGAVRGRRVLDAACGPGLYVEELLRRGAEVVGCDASATMIERARDRVGPSVDLRVHALEDPFDWIPDESVDVVVSALAYHYLNDRPAFLAEMHRVLTADGVLVISTHHPTAEWYRLGGSYFEIGTVTETWRRGWEVTTWRLPLTQLTQEFADAGFVIERLVEPLPVPELADLDPDRHRRLSTEPGFILFRLRPVVSPVGS